MPTAFAPLTPGFRAEGAVLRASARLCPPLGGPLSAPARPGRLSVQGTMSAPRDCPLSHWPWAVFGVRGVPA